MNAYGKYESLLLELTGKAHTVLAVSAVGGGSINRCHSLQTDKGKYFLKENDAKKFPGMFGAEKTGLETLAAHTALVVPAPAGILNRGPESFLLLEWLEKTAGQAGGWYDAGEKLAALHRNSATQFGFGQPNYIGSLPQSNKHHGTWQEFFTLERILPLVKRARDIGQMDRSLAQQAEKFCAQADNIFPPEKPALLHGDLWSGNFMFTAKGPSVFDPAVYYGHREMDLSMTKLFGGFEADFYAGYRNAYAPEPGWEKRIPYGNLYPLLVHLNLFGSGYLYDVKSILSAF